MKIIIELSSGKKLELTEDEAKELFGKQAQPFIPMPYPTNPYPTNPYPIWPSPYATYCVSTGTELTIS